MRDEDLVDKFEAKTQNIRVSKDINKVQRDVHNLATKKIISSNVVIEEKKASAKQKEKEEAQNQQRGIQLKKRARQLICQQEIKSRKKEN